MSLALILKTDAPIRLVMNTGSRLKRAFSHEGNLMYLPGAGGVCLVLDGGSDSVTDERLLAAIAGTLGGHLYTPDGDPWTPSDCDTDFLSHIAAPEDEILPLYCRFRIRIDAMIGYRRRIMSYFNRLDLEVLNEADGVAIAMAHNCYLDLFYREDRDPEGRLLGIEIAGECDTTFAGPAAFADICRIADGLATDLGGSLEWERDPAITYTDDGDFTRLQERYYEMLRQQLAFALEDDRNGFPAYAAWPVDTYEPQHIPGSIVSWLGRLDIDRLVAEIEEYGFAFMADTRFFLRSRPGEMSDELAEGYAKCALGLLWTNVTGVSSARDGFHRERNQLAVEYVRRALACDPSVPLPAEAVRNLFASAGEAMPDLTNAAAYIGHYPIGYLHEPIGYGFGSYLRHVLLPGSAPYYEPHQGVEAVFYDDGVSGFQLDCRIEYFDEEAQPAVYGEDECPSDCRITSYDIGGSSWCRLREWDADGELRALAEILILDERYTLSLRTSRPSAMEMFREAVSQARAVEMVDEIAFTGPDEKPRAPGSVFFVREAPEIQLKPDIQSAVLVMAAMNSSPAWHFELHEAPDAATLSKVGGRPYGLKPEQYPCTDIRCPDGTKIVRPMAFFAQINFADMEGIPEMPGEGILQLFFDIPNGIIFENGRPRGTIGTDQIRLVWHPTVREKDKWYDLASTCYRMDGEMTHCPMTPCDYRFEDRVMPGLKFYQEICAEEDEEVILEAFRNHDCMIGGYPDLNVPDLRNMMPLPYEVLLFQLVFRPEDTECRPPQLGEGDVRLQVFISREDLEKRDFSRPYVVYTRD